MIRPRSFTRELFTREYPVISGDDNPMRGCRPAVTFGRAKKFPERQGYRWVPNLDSDIPSDAFVYLGNDMFVLRVVTCRNAPGSYDLHKDFFRQDYGTLGKLPLSPWLPHEVRVRYRWRRAFHRFRLFGTDFCEVEMIDRVQPVFPCEPATIPSFGEEHPEKDAWK